MQIRTTHIFLLTTLVAVLLVFVLPILLRAPLNVHLQLCQDLGIDDPDKTRVVASSAFDDPSGVHHTYFLLDSSSDEEHVLRHVFHTPSKLWWRRSWYPLDTSTLQGLGYSGLALDGSRIMAGKPSQAEIDTFLAPLKTVLGKNSITFAK